MAIIPDLIKSQKSCLIDLMSSWVERLRGFRLISPSFDGDSELGKFLGLNTPNGIVTPEKKETIPPKMVDEATLKMVSYLRHEIDEEPNSDAGTP